MIDTYSRGNVTLTVEEVAGAEKVMFAIIRAAPLTDTEVRHLNSELADYPAAHGAQLVNLPGTDEWAVRADTVLVSDHGNPTAELRWAARPRSVQLDNESVRRRYPVTNKGD